MTDTYQNTLRAPRLQMVAYLEKVFSAYDRVLTSAASELRRAPRTYALIAVLLLSTSSAAAFSIGWAMGHAEDEKTQSFQFCTGAEISCQGDIFPLTTSHGDGFNGLPLSAYLEPVSSSADKDPVVLPLLRPNIIGDDADGLQPEDFLPNEKQAVVINSILLSADKTGADKTYMMATGWRETKFDINGKSRSSSARGLFQFTTVTWFRAIHAFGAKHGYARLANAISILDDNRVVVDPELRQDILALRYNPRAAALMTGELAMLDKVRLERMTGLDIDWVDVYIAHFLGITTGANFLEALHHTPSLAVNNVVSTKAYARNKTIFVAKSGKPKTVRQVFDSIHGKFAARMKRYERLFELDAAGLLRETREARANDAQKAS